MRKKKMNKLRLLIILLLGIGVGYAALSTTLKITGTTTVNKSTWSVYWTNIANQSGITPSSGPSIGNDQTEGENTVVSWGVVLDKPGDFFEFTIDAVNAGTLDAMITGIEYKLNNAEITSQNKLPDYVKYTVTYADDVPIALKHRLAKATVENNVSTPTVETYKIRLEYTDDVTRNDINDQSGNITYNLSFKVKYGQADNTAMTKPIQANFATDSWETIVAAYKGGATKYLETAMKAGTTKEVSLDMDHDDVYETTAHVRIANLSTPSECSTAGFSQTACGFVIEFADVIDTHRMNCYESNADTNGDGNKGAWAYTDMRAYLNGNMYARKSIDYTGIGLIDAMDDSLSSLIIGTRVVSGQGSSDIISTILPDEKLYLLSTHEVYEDTDGSANLGISSYDKQYSKTRQLDYYKEKGVTTEGGHQAAAIKQNLSDTNASWWLRTAVNTGTDKFFRIVTTGHIGDSLASDDTTGVSPAFRLG